MSAVAPIAATSQTSGDFSVVPITSQSNGFVRKILTVPGAPLLEQHWAYAYARILSRVLSH